MCHLLRGPEWHDSATLGWRLGWPGTVDPSDEATVETNDPLSVGQRGTECKRLFGVRMAGTRIDWRMAFDERLAARVRACLADRPDVVEKKMFGGLTFMVRGQMACGVLKDELIVKVGEVGLEAALGRPHTRSHGLHRAALEGHGLRRRRRRAHPGGGAQVGRARVRAGGGSEHEAATLTEAAGLTTRRQLEASGSRRRPRKARRPCSRRSRVACMTASTSR
jgi:hypothetical protein